jgi:ligand-binding sensor domain-containing protein
VRYGFYFFSLILAWPASGLFAQYQPIRFDHCSVRQGLSQGSGYTITHDKDGFIWMGTQNGLNRFDGHEISVFYQGKNGYRGSSHINSLITDSSGTVWIGSTGGLTVLDYASRRFLQAGEFLRQPTMLDSIHIVKIWQDHRRNIWVLSFSKGVFCIRTNGHIDQYGGSGNIDVRPVDITADKNGVIWLAFRQSVNRFTHQDPRFELESLTGIDDKTDIRAMLIDSENQLWIGTFDKGIYIYSLSDQL